MYKTSQAEKPDIHQKQDIQPTSKETEGNPTKGVH
jgi:hypothetical protein